MMLTVSLVQFVQEIVAPTFVDARRELTERFTAKSARVHQWRY
jgi:hypothetical protein